jgi:predicted TIM-barrel fold metal-dependent hydrolase
MLTIDADAHVLENPHTWDFLEESEEGLRPEIIVSERKHTKAEMRDKWDRVPKRGTEYWFVDGRLQPKSHNVGLDTSPEAREMRDVEARLRHMDELEVDVQVLYPTLFLRPVTMKPTVELALCRTYNRWLAGLCDGTKGRLRWIALLPFLTMDKALAELAWARDAGACGFMMRGLEGEKQITDPYYFPVYEEAARLDLPACVHSGIASFTYQDLFPVQAGFRRFKLAVVGDFHSLIMEGIPARFPGLRFGFIEVSAQWLPYVIHDLKRLSERQGMVFPDDVLRENRVYVACQTEDDLDYVLSYSGEDNIVIGSDYGHHDTSSEIEALRRLREDGKVPAGAVEKIMGDNARALYAL